MTHRKRFGFASVFLFALLCSGTAWGQNPTPTPTPTPTPNPLMGRATLQIRGVKTSDMPTLLSRQLAVGWSTTLGIWDSLWVGTNGHGNIQIWPAAVPTIPSSLPPSGPAGGRLSGSFPNPALSPSGVVAKAYGGTNKTVSLQIDAAGTVTSASETDIAFPAFPAFPAIPTTLPPSGTAGGRLAGTYPNPALAASGVTAGTYGSASAYPVVTVSADGTVSSVIVQTLPAAPIIPTTLPPSGTASGDLTGTYPAPTLTVITTAKTVGASTQIPVVTVDAKGRVTALTTVTAADPWAAKIQTKRVTVPSLLSLALSDVVVTWATPYADTNYTASVSIAQPSSLVGVLVDYAIVGQTTTGITVRIKNLSLGAMAPVIHATAIHD